MIYKLSSGIITKQWLVCCYLFLLFAASCIGQITYTPQSILQNVIRANESTSTQYKIDTNVDLPARQRIDQMEFRTEFNELDFEQTEYTFRVGFRNDKIRRLQNQLYQMQLNYLDTEHEYSMESDAESVYKGIVAWHYAQVRDSLLRQTTNLLEDKNKLELALFQNDNKVNFNDILKINERNKEIKMNIFDARLSKKETFAALGIQDTSARLDQANWISISTLIDVVEGLESGLVNHPTLQLQTERISLLNQEYLLEESDVDNILDFVQLKYKIDDKQPIEKELSLGVAFLLPYKRTNTANLAKIEIEKIEETYKERQLLYELRTELEEESQELNILIERYDFLMQFAEDDNLQSLKETYLESEQVSPLPLVNLELMLTERRLDLIIVEQEVYLQYIRTLGNLGMLRLSMNTNYLDEELAPIR